MSGGGQLTVVTSAANDAGVVLLTGAQAISTSKTYQLWYLNPDGTFTSAGVMPSGANSSTAVVAGLHAGETVGMTIEKAGGAAQPSMDPLVRLNV